jgi:hypothetical protein
LACGWGGEFVQFFIKNRCQDEVNKWPHGLIGIKIFFEDFEFSLVGRDLRHVEE